MAAIHYLQRWNILIKLNKLNMDDFNILLRTRYYSEHPQNRTNKKEYYGNTQYEILNET